MEQATRLSHIQHPVDLVDQQGNPVGSVRRAEINKRTDLYNSVFVIARRNNQILLGEIPDRTDLENLYVEKLGATAVTIRRTDESSQDAAIRAVRKELCILPRPDTLNMMGETYAELPDGRTNYMSVFHFTPGTPVFSNNTDTLALKSLTANQITEQLASDPDRFAPTLHAIWEQYGHEFLKEEASL